MESLAVLPSRGEPTGDPRTIIIIQHPRTGTTILSLFARFNEAESHEGQYLPLILVCDACRVLTQDYQSTHILSTSKAQQDLDARVVLPRLPGGLYYLHVLDNDDYTTCNSFVKWAPPERSMLPAHWFNRHSPRVSSVDCPDADWTMPSAFATQIEQQSICIISSRTTSSRSIEAAHILPKAYSAWYHQHQLWNQLHVPIPLPEKSGINDARNAVALDTRWHKILDSFMLAFYPRGDEWVAIFIRGRDSSARRNHMRTVNMPNHIDSYLLYLRFALLVLDAAGVKLLGTNVKVASSLHSDWPLDMMELDDLEPGDDTSSTGSGSCGSRSLGRTSRGASRGSNRVGGSGGTSRSGNGGGNNPLKRKSEQPHDPVGKDPKAHQVSGTGRLALPIGTDSDGSSDGGFETTIRDMFAQNIPSPTTWRVYFQI
ncbi:hypothetical protein BKA62DRAFT_826033 [Auriculariales sp. MPI-PUGE-AT-0066]|nr:hypothetical protein BKA62DRAFT_826033 [Auriculariales sp. MPI-PUGE-AT-0066]